MEQIGQISTGNGLEELVINTNKLNMVTGAFSYTGRYITRRLLSIGERVKTLTGHPEKNPFGDQVEAFPYNFGKPEELTNSLCGVDTLYNTYWIRFSYGDMTFDRAVDNSKILIESAQKAGVRRIVYISVTNADEESRFPYFRGKGAIEKFIQESGLGYAILRPALIFGRENTLINNIAWLMIKSKRFVMFGDGNYRLCPIYVEDLAELAVDAAHRDKDIITDVIGPGIFTFKEFVHLINDKIGIHAKIGHASPWRALFYAKMIGNLVGDILITEDEVDGLMMDLLYSAQPPNGKTRFSSWLEKNRDIGAEYVSQLKMHFIC